MTDDATALEPCSFTLDITAWNEQHDAEDGGFERRLHDDGIWRCYRRTRPGDDYCLFHAHESDDAVSGVAERGQVFRDIVNATTDERAWNAEADGLWEVPRHPPEREQPFDRDEYKRREKQFVGASLGRVQLAHERLDGPDAYPIDLRLATVESLDLEHASVGHALWAQGLDQTDDAGGLRFEGARFDARLELADASASGDVDLSKAGMAAVCLDDAVVDGEVSIEEATVRGSMAARALEATGDLSAERSTLDAAVTLGGAGIGGALSFEGADIDKTVHGKDLTVEGALSFNSADIGGSVFLNGSENSAASVSLFNARVRLTVNLSGDAVGGDLSLMMAEIGLGVGLSDLSISGTVDFEAAELGEEISVSDATIAGDITLDSVEVGGRSDIEFSATTVEGTVAFTNATLGHRVEVSRGSEIATLRFENTEIDDGLELDDAQTDTLTIDGTRIRGSLGVDGGSIDELLITETVVEDSVSLAGTTIDDTLAVTDADLHGTVDISDADLGGPLRFDGTTVTGDVRIRATAADRSIAITETEVTGAITIDRNTTVGEAVDLRATDAAHASIECELTHPGVGAVPLTDAAIDDGVLAVRHEHRSDADGAVYDFARTTLGDVDVAEHTDRPFEHARFLETAFDGFVFSRKRQQFRDTDWQVHRPRADGYEDIAFVTQTVHTDDGDRVVFPAARDIGEALAATLLKGRLEEHPGRDDGPLAEWVERVVTTYRFEIANASLVRSYLGDELDRPAVDDQPTRGDPVSGILDRLRPRRTTTALPSSDGRTAVFDAVGEIEAAIDERLDLQRVRRARATGSDDFATDRFDNHLDRLEAATTYPMTDDSRGLQASGEGDDHRFVERNRTASDRSTDGDEAASSPRQFETPDVFDVAGGENVSSRAVADAVAETLATAPSLTRTLATADPDVQPDREPEQHRDGGLPAPVEAIRAAWDVPAESPLVGALTDAADPICELAAAIEDDHQRLARAGLAPADPPDGAPDTGPAPFGALADVALDRSAVETAEAVARQLLGSDRIDRRVFEPIDCSLADLESSVARDLVAPAAVAGTDNELESTYAAAKNGASEAGDETAAGNFFQREAAYARRQHWQRGWDGLDGPTSAISLASPLLGVALGVCCLLAGLAGGLNTLALSVPLLSGSAIGVALFVTLSVAGLLTGWRSLGDERALYAWVGNLFLWTTMGYGERPRRVLGFSAGIVALFSAVYWLADAAFGVGLLDQYGDLGYLVFSLGSFVTLLVENPGIESQLVRLLAVLEGFIGVFVIGMFVVTVTRAVHR